MSKKKVIEILKEFEQQDYKRGGVSIAPEMYSAIADKIHREIVKTEVGRPKGQSTMESWMIANGKSGEHFYSNKADRHLTAISTQHNRKIVTERLITITTGGKEPISKYITKVTLL